MNKYHWYGPDETSGKFEYKGEYYDQVEISKKLKGKPDGIYRLVSQDVIVVVIVKNNVVVEFGTVI